MSRQAAQLSFIIIKIRPLLYPVEIVIGLVFLGGSFFVSLVFGLSGLTVVKIQDVERETVRA